MREIDILHSAARLLTRTQIREIECTQLMNTVQVVISKGLAEGNIEVGLRHKKGEKATVPIAEAVTYLTELVAAEKAALKR